jgi:hypothetical protein
MQIKNYSNQSAKPRSNILSALKMILFLLAIVIGLNFYFRYGSNIKKFVKEVKQLYAMIILIKDQMATDNGPYYYKVEDNDSTGIEKKIIIYEFDEPLFSFVHDDIEKLEIGRHEIEIHAKRGDDSLNSKTYIYMIHSGSCFLTSEVDNWSKKKIGNLECNIGEARIVNEERFTSRNMISFEYNGTCFYFGFSVDIDKEEAQTLEDYDISADVEKMENIVASIKLNQHQ